MKINLIKTLKVTSLLSSLAAVIVYLGVGCGVGWQPIGSAQFSSFGIPTDVGNNGDLSIIPNQKTIAVANYTSVLDNMVSMAQVEPSRNTTNIFNQKLGSFSEKGDVTSINAPMLMGFMAVGAEVCNDLLTQEAASEARRFYPQNMNLAGNGNTNATESFSDAVIEDVSRRFARQFWQRQIENEELELVRAGVREMLASAPSPTERGLTRRAGLYICTAMISSTSAYEL